MQNPLITTTYSFKFVCAEGKEETPECKCKCKILNRLINELNVELDLRTFTAEEAFAHGGGYYHRWRREIHIDPAYLGTREYQNSNGDWVPVELSRVIIHELTEAFQKIKNGSSE